jgi:SAM-dependent methyltransferase
MEINLMDQYPRSRRSLAARNDVTDADRRLAGQFGRDYFDGARKHGYGGYHYHPRFWQGTVRRLRDHYQLPADASILDVGCAKGFMLHDFRQLMPESRLRGIDISRYALEHAVPEIRACLQIGNAKQLPFADGAFDLVTAINTIHNLELAECKQALREIQRVSRHAFIIVDAWRTPEQQRLLKEWVLTAKTFMHVEDWQKVFREAGYTRDYYWFFFE